MKFLFIDTFKIVRVLELPYRPIPGDKIDYGYFPFATVKSVLICPRKDTLEELAKASEYSFENIGNAEAIIYLD